MSPLLDSRDVLDLLRTEQLFAVFQPIFNLPRGALFGFEGLIRGPADSALHNPLTLFEAASREQKLTELEYLCRKTVCSRFQQLQLPGKLFLNVSPLALIESGAKRGMTGEILASVGLDPGRIVIEITEQYPLRDYELIREATAHYRAQGFQIALDDLGAGYSSLRSWSEIQPDYVKIDRHFIENLALDSAKREFVKSIEGIARRLGCKVIAEGIESDAELRVLSGMGVEFGQGFGLGRPSPKPSGLVPLALRDATAPSAAMPLGARVPLAGSLAQPCQAFDPATPAEDVFERLRTDRDMAAAPIVDQGRPLGLVERDELLELFSGRYMRELHARKPIRQFLDAESVIVDEKDPIELVSRRLTRNRSGRLPDCFIVARDGWFIGVGQTRDLLERITQQQIQAARYSSPLTGLPGNVPIYEAVDALLKSLDPFAIAYFDLNQFKPFNDAYGYSQGDRVIQLVSDLLLTQTDRDRDFVGHIGGDDFVVIFRSEDWSRRCRSVLSEFDTGVRRFYTEKALAEGGVWSEDRGGKPYFFEILSLACGAAQPDPARCLSHHDVAALATSAKREAKKWAGSYLFVSKRRGPEIETGESVSSIAVPANDAAVVKQL